MKTTVGENEGGRLDVVMAAAFGITRSYAEKLVSLPGAVLVNGEKPKKSGQAVRAGDEIVCTPPEARETVSPCDIPFGLLYEDGDIAVIDKPQGLTVHPAGGNYDRTLVNALMYRLDRLSGINGEIRPGIVHRLDKNTSGIMVVAKNDEAHLSLSRQIAERTVVKQYVALLEGIPKDEKGTIDAPIGRSLRDRKSMAVVEGGRRAVTEYRVVTRFRENSFVLFRIHTGRTHQIRVHAKYMGHPVVGDDVYGFRKQRFATSGQLLHSYRLEFTHPRTGERLAFTAPVPEHIVRIYDILARESGAEPFNERILANLSE